MRNEWLEWMHEWELIPMNEWGKGKESMRMSVGVGNVFQPSVVEGTYWSSRAGLSFLPMRRWSWPLTICTHNHNHITVPQSHNVYRFISSYLAETWPVGMFAPSQWAWVVSYRIMMLIYVRWRGRSSKFLWVSIPWVACVVAVMICLHHCSPRSNMADLHII